MELKISTKSFIYTFRNVYYDEEAGLLKTLLCKSASNSIIFDYLEIKLFLEEIMDNKYFSDNINEIINQFNKNDNSDLLLYKISNMLIHYKNNHMVKNIKYKINKKFIELNTLDFDSPQSQLIEKNYKNLWFLINHFESVKMIVHKKENFTIYDYIIDNLN